MPSRSRLVVSVLVFGFLVSLTRDVCGQKNQEIDADRDAFTPTTHTVDAGRWLTETAYTYIQNRSGAPTMHIVYETIPIVVYSIARYLVCVCPYLIL